MKPTDSGTGRRLKIEYRATASLKRANRNARVHPKRQIEQLVAAIKQFGFTNPILVDEKAVIIAGHGRLEAALILELARVPVIEIPGLTSDQKRALALADNRLAENAEWDEDILRTELEYLVELNGAIDLSSIGFTEAEVSKLLGADANGDDAPPQYRETFAVIVDVGDEQQQVALLKRLTDEGFKCRALVA